MRLIDADALIKENAYASDMWDRETQSFDLPIVEVRDIEDAPSIDIVRCKECKHRTYCYGDVFWTNKRQTVDIHKDIDFCSLGEREGE